MPETVLSFTVHGKPATAGSKRAYVYTPAGGGKPRAAIAPANDRQKPFMAAVSAEAAEAMRKAEWELVRGPIKLRVIIELTRPQSHFGSGKNAFTVKASAPEFPTSKPDSLKVCRAVEDAMSGIVYKDDSQIVAHEISKVYGAANETWVTVWEL